MKQAATRLKDRGTVEAERSKVVAQLRGGDLFIRDYPRYLNPPPDTPYPLECGYFLLGDICWQAGIGFWVRSRRELRFTSIARSPNGWN